MGDVINTKDSRGVDIKEVHAFMDENYLYVLIQVDGKLEPSLQRNYFVALDFDNNYVEEYHFGVRPTGETWVFDLRTDKKNWVEKNAIGVLTKAQTDTIELKIPRKEYGIPSRLAIYSRVTEGGPTVDQTNWVEVKYP